MTKHIRLAALEPVTGTAAVGVKLLKLRLADDGSILASEPHRCVLYKDGVTVAAGHHGETVPVPALVTQIEALNAGLAQMGFPSVADDDIAKIAAMLVATAP